jgi:hypothetical protein
LTLSVTDEETSFLQEKDCKQHNFYIICSKSSNTTAVLLNPYTVNREKTSKGISTLKSAKDNRTIAKVIGGIGVLVLVVFLALFVVIDFGNLVKTCKKKHFCKNKITRIRVQPLQSAV